MKLYYYISGIKEILYFTHLFLMPGLTSTILSELATTLIATSPAPASFFFKKLLTLFSIYVPSFVTGNLFALNLLSFRFADFFLRQLSQTNLKKQYILLFHVGLYSTYSTQALMWA